MTIAELVSPLEISKSGLPSPLNSAAITHVVFPANVGGRTSTGVEKPPLPLPSAIITLAGDAVLTTVWIAKSGLPSRFTSPIARMEKIAFGTVVVERAVKPPAPSPFRIFTVFRLATDSCVARSNSRSPSKSPTTNDSILNIAGMVVTVKLPAPSPSKSEPAAPKLAMTKSGLLSELKSPA